MSFSTTVLSVNLTWRPAIEQYDHGYGNLTVLSDSNNETCLSLDFHHLDEPQILLIGSLSHLYKNLHVAVHTRSLSLHFQGDTCVGKPSVLMSHVGPKCGSPCRDFCGVPSTCNLNEKQNTDSAITTLHLDCICPEQSCLELLLWLWEPSGSIIAGICEIEVS